MPCQWSRWVVIRVGFNRNQRQFAVHAATAQPLVGFGGGG
jgi:hypothetical protein